MEQLSIDFNNKVLDITNNIMIKIQQFKGEIPINIGLINMAKGMLINYLDENSVIDIFIEDFYLIWDAIYNKNEGDIIEIIKDKAPHIAESINPMFAHIISGMLPTIIDFILKNRNELLGEYEEKLWEEVGNLIRISINYAHLKREPKFDESSGVTVMKYTQRFAPKISLKKESEKWNVKL